MGVGFWNCEAEINFEIKYLQTIQTIQTSKSYSAHKKPIKIYVIACDTLQ